MDTMIPTTASMGEPDAQELPQVLTDAVLDPLWRGLHERFCAGRPVTSVRLDGLDGAGRGAVADLLGSARYPGSAVALARLNAALADIAGVDARTVVEHLVGPIENRAAQRAAVAREREELWTWLRGHLVVRAQPVLLEWADTLQRTGVGAPAQARPLLESALAVLDRLPAGGAPLPAFAEAVLADPHALDDGTRLAAVALRAVAALLDAEPPTSAEQRRTLWERVGVAEDELSATVLVAGVRPAGENALAVILRTCAAAGHAAVLTLAQVRAAEAVPLTAGSVVHVVENPSILALALRRFGTRCPPLVCTSGWPSGAGVLLLRRLAEHGHELRYHGDLDGDGVRIAAYVMAKTGARPWRMSESDYRAAVPLSGPPVGRVSAAPWDTGLADAMVTCGIAVVEERTSELLLADLAGRSAAFGSVAAEVADPIEL
jgi:uncharacterized protein (TIGR02679 family)